MLSNKTSIGLSEYSSGTRAVVTDAIRPYRTGRVKFQGTWWPASCKQNVVLEPGTNVNVLDREGLTLIVEAIPLPVSSCS